jgi:hypothetical protein
VTLPRIDPTPSSSEWLADLVADAGAIPAAAFSRGNALGEGSGRVGSLARIDLTAVPQQRSALRIPDAGLSLATAAEYCF